MHTLARGIMAKKETTGVERPRFHVTLESYAQTNMRVDSSGLANFNAH